jgi:hypothetical protein
MRLIVVHPRRINSFALKGLKWIYADQKIDVKSAVSIALDPNLELITPRDFQIFARSIRDKLIESVDSCISSSNLDLWVLTSLHRSPFANNIFLHQIWVAYLRTRQDDSSTIIVITESLGLFKTLKEIFSHRGKLSAIGIIWFWLSFIKILIRSSLGGIISINRFIARMVLSRIMLSKEFLSRGVDAVVLLDTYLYDDDISENGSYRSPYMPGLTEWYEDQNIPVALIATISDDNISRLPNLYRRMRLSVNIIIPFERLVSWFEFLKILLRVVYFLASKKDNDDGEFARDYINLIAYSRYQAAVSNILPLLFGTIPQRLNSFGYKPKLVLSWFENQQRDRAIAKNVSTWFSDALHVAFRPYIACYMHANLFTTARQHIFGVCPPETWVSGRGMLDMMQHIDKKSRYRVMPALRYQHLWGIDSQKATENTLLILLSHSISESMNIMECVFGCVSIATKHMEIQIKPHRDIPVEFLKQLVINRWELAGKAKWVTGPISDFLSEARIVITTGSSSALEAACYGKPVIIIGSLAGLTMNPMTLVDQQIWEEVYSSSELSEVLVKWLPFHPLPYEVRIKIGKDIREKYFTPVNADTMKGFLP